MLDLPGLRGQRVKKQSLTDGDIRLAGLLLGLAELPFCLYCLGLSLNSVGFGLTSWTGAKHQQAMVIRLGNHVSLGEA